MVVTREEFSHIKLLLKRDHKSGSKVSRVADKTGWSPETIRCINKFETFDEYQARKAKKVVADEPEFLNEPQVNVNVFEDNDEDENHTILPLVLALVLLGVVILFVVFK